MEKNQESLQLDTHATKQSQGSWTSSEDGLMATEEFGYGEELGEPAAGYPRH